MKAPTLIIGLGGIGSEICAKVSNMLPTGNPDNIGFLIVDTDVNSIQELRRKGFRGTVCQISRNQTIDKYLRDGDEKDLERGWFPESRIFLKKSMTEGAGQMRSISRLALDDAIRSGRMNELHHMLRSLCSSATGRQLRVFIISSLEGGTGSGIALYLAMYIEWYLKKKYRDYMTNIKGFFLLPSFMEPVLTKPGEKVNVAANAYAAVKEISAFMTKYEDDGLSKNEELCMYLAREGRHDYIKYDESPFFYCYLYGDIKLNGSAQGSYEDRKIQVARTVYMQAFSGMEQKNNSLEDNVTNILIGQMNHNLEKRIRRFAGCGCVEVVYPYQILKKFYALKWAAFTMGRQWKKYDDDYCEKEIIEAKKKGRRVSEVHRKNEYIAAIHSAERNDLLADNIRKSCIYAGEEKEEKTWLKYVTEIENEITARFHLIWDELDNGNKDFCKFSDSLDNITKKDRKNARKYSGGIREEYDIVHGIARKLPEKHCRYISKDLFSHHQSEERRPYEIEKWLTYEDSFIHPNAVRYFLYNLTEVLERRISDLELDIKEKIEIYSGSKYKEIKNRYRRTTKSSVYQELHDTMLKLIEALKEAVQMEMKKKCFEEGLNYARRLSRNYEQFYDGYEDMLNDFEEKISNIELELHRKHEAYQYVCVNDECIRKDWEKMQEGTGILHVGDGLSKKLYDLMQEELKSLRDKQRCFGQIEEHWYQSWEEEFRHIYDIDILQALRKELIYGCKGEVMNITADDIIDKLDDSSEKASPMLQSIRNQVPHEIQICCYNKGLKKLDGIFKDVVGWLDERGVEEEVYCNKYQIIFYRAFWGIDYYEVQEFSHERDKNLKDKLEGEKFKHYEESVKHMQFIGNDPVSTPHIDKKWHNYGILPDGDGYYQRQNEILIAKAFIYGILSSGIKQSGLNLNYMEAGSEEPIELGTRFFDVHKYFYAHANLAEKYNKRLQEEAIDKLQKRIEDGIIGQTEHLDNNDCLAWIFGSNNVYMLINVYVSQMTTKERSQKIINLLLESAKEILKDYIEKIEPEGVDVKAFELMNRKWDEIKNRDVNNKISIKVEIEDYFNNVRRGG